MDIKHAIIGLLLGLLVIFAAYLYKDFKESGKSVPFLETTMQ